MKKLFFTLSLFTLLLIINPVSLYGQSFTQDIASSMVGISSGSVDWGDYDSDGDQDILLTGNGTAIIYRNDGGIFTDISAGLAGVYNSAARWGDFDNDGDLDLALSGGGISGIYRNDAGFFSDISAGIAGLNESSLDWGDYDNDGDIDLALAGSSGTGMTLIYRNNGGQFENIDAEIPGLGNNGSVSWGDYDNDGDLDLFLAGYNPIQYLIGEVYRNDNGVFVSAETGITGCYGSSADWGDYDNDGDLDLLVTGYNWNSGILTKIFNNNTGSFTDSGILLPGVQDGTAIWGDYDNDGDLDILVSGNGTTSVYSNSGGLFTDVSAGLPGLYNSAAAWGDYDNDGDLDILMSGSGQTLLYINNIPAINNVPVTPSGLTSTVTGSTVTLSWTKTTDTETPQNGLSYNMYIGSAPSASDIMAPMSFVPAGKRQVMRKGQIQTNSRAVKGLPAGTYYWSVQAVDNSFAGSAFAAEGSFTVPFSNNIPFTGDLRLQTGQNGACLTVNESQPADSRQWKYSLTEGGPYDHSFPLTGTTCCPYFSEPGEYYIVCESLFEGITYVSNEVKCIASMFMEYTESTLINIKNGDAAWGDYDNDGDKDVLITGFSATGRISRIYRNDGGVLNEQPGIVLEGVDASACAWGDYDNDGDLDIIITGNGISGPLLKVYENNSDNSFTEQSIISTAGIADGSVSWGDYDNDGDLDLVLTGNTVSGDVSIIYRNDAGVFTDINAGIKAGYLSSTDWGDYDNDGDLDLLISGYNSTTYGFSEVYRNDNGAFTNSGIELIANPNSSVSWGDYDNDGDLDILLTNYYNLSLYSNNNGVFTGTGNFPVIQNGEIAWGDFDNDGDLDFITAGNFTEGVGTKIYQNNNNVFTEYPAFLEGVLSGSLDWADFDNDGDLDILITGISSSGALTRIYRNHSEVVNTAPNPPSNLAANVTGTGVTLSWNKATDAQTLQNGLSYDLYLGTSPGIMDIRFPMSEIPGGYRKVVGKGQVQGNSWQVKRLPVGTYYWSVQAVDHSFSGSNFAAEATFTVPFYLSVSPETEQVLNLYQDGNPLTVTESTPPAVRQWKYSLTSGGPYNQAIPGATGVTYTPNFSAFGIYYVICEAVHNAVTYTSNEVKISVPAFTDTGETGIPYFNWSTSAWGDYDNDGDQDLLIGGEAQFLGYYTGVYNNNGGVFTDISAGLTGLYRGSVAWADYNNDGALDILITGSSGGGNISRIYSNNGSGVFTEEISAILPPLSDGSDADWGDYDNDGDPDLVLSGSDGSKDISAVFRNDNGLFTDIKAGLSGTNYSTNEWGDFDSDGDIDILSSNGRIYRNDKGIFVEIGSGLSGTWDGAATWGDYDNDGDLDVLFAGGDFTRVYRNDNGIFNDIQAGLQNIDYGCSVAWGDYDNDGDLDVLITGSYSKIYRNDSGVFTPLSESFAENQGGTSNWVDYDNDGDLDLFMSGAGSIKIYRNNGTVSNSPPDAPANLAVTFSGSTVELTWDRSNDAETPQDGLSYNIYIGTYPGTASLGSPMANLADGYRRTTRRGPLQGNTWKTKKLTAGTYYWGVQAIDNGYRGSSFSSENSFTIAFSSSVIPLDDQTLAINQDGTTLTVIESSAPSSRQWKYSTVKGGPYDQVITGAVNSSYTPNFSSWGTYYVICESVYDGASYTTDEVRINVVVFSEDTGVVLPGVSYSSSAWGDYDNDGDLDAVISGGWTNSKIFSNNAGVFTDISAPLDQFVYGTSVWGDYDNDNDLDLLLSGYNGSTNVTKIYNNNSGIFSDIGSGLPGLQYSSAAWGDYDNDGDLDLLLAGYTGSEEITQIFRNENGIFTGINAGLQGICRGSVAWGDYDNDRDLDILLTGSGRTSIYRNNNGTFELVSAGLNGNYNSSAAWGDYDNDGDLDILVTGSWDSKLYANNNGVFSDMNLNFPSLNYSSVCWGDYDNDGDPDILVSGNDGLQNVTKILNNDGGIFSEIPADMPGISRGSAIWGDYDNDSDLDILLSGNGFSKVFRNNIPYVNTVPSAPTSLSAIISGSSVELSWAKSSDDKTLQNGLSYNLYIGTAAGTTNKISPMADLSTGFMRVARKGLIQGNSYSLKRLGSGWFFWSVQAVDNSFMGSAFAAEGNFYIPFANTIDPSADQQVMINQDGLPLTVTESPAASSRQWKYSTVPGGPYTNEITGATGLTYTPNFNSFGIFYIICESVYNSVAYQSNEVKIIVPAFSPMPGGNLVMYSSVAWGDYDNDNDPDLFISGYSSSGIISRIYRNDSGGMFTETNPGFQSVYNGSSAWGDYDNDGDLDIIITGSDDFNHYSKIYRNDAGTFIDIGASLDNVSYSDVEWGDYDNDGDLDILLTGYNGTTNITAIYRNDNGSFSNSGIRLPGVDSGSADWGDFDADGDLDILLTGSGQLSIYRNDNGGFNDIAAGLSGIYNSSASWGDYDSDGDLDILVTGNLRSEIYRNDNGLFNNINAGLTGFYSGSAEWGDVDNDGDPDILLTGYTSAGNKSEVYLNDAGTFTRMMTDLKGVGEQSTGTFADYDNDGDLDILLSGSPDFTTLLYTNNSSNPNTPPGIPANLQAEFGQSYVTLTWDKASDTQTSQAGLSYNIYIGTAPGMIDKRSPMASLADGMRRIVRSGSVQGSSWKIKGLNATTYYWGVQAIDNSFSASSFSAEGSFTVPFSSTITPSSDQNLASERDGATLTVNESSTPSSRQWKYSAVKGGPYEQVIEGATDQTYTPNFKNTGVFYIICESVFEGTAYISNEVTVNVDDFEEITGTGLPVVRNGSTVWGDYDNDGDYDLFISGQNYTGYVAGIYKVQNQTFTNITAGIPGVISSSAAWSDYDNDGDLDILVTGLTQTGMPVSIIYRNDNGFFNDINAGLPGVHRGSVAWGDIDNDGDQDILLAGSTGQGNISRIYINDAGIFRDYNENLPGVSYSSSAFVDFDNDGDLDILISGHTGTTPITKIFRNDNGTFTDINVALQDLYRGSADWGDYDNDGDVDLLLTGNGYAIVYSNQDGQFSDINAGLPGVYYSSAIWGDYDHDGDLDILLAGRSVTDYNSITRVYRNDEGAFTDISAGLTGVYSGSISWTDLNDDRDFDIVITGYSVEGVITKVYRNLTDKWNNVPSQPFNLNATITGTGIELSWDVPWDNSYPQAALSANIYIGTSSGAVNKRSPMAALSDGKRRILQAGAIRGNKWKIKRLPAGTYFWSVQAIDDGFGGSAFATQGTFTVPFSSTVTPSLEQVVHIDQTDAVLTVNESTTPDSRQWKYSEKRGGPYDNILTGVTGITCNPAFNEPGIYYVICESVENGIAYISNEVKFVVNDFIISQASGIPALSNSSASWGDYDSDGDLDLFISGNSAEGLLSRIYRNDAGIFSDIGAGLPGVERGSSNWGDFDNDGDLDLLMTGYVSASSAISKIFTNDGSTFTDTGLDLIGVYSGSSEIGDYDNDGDLDILLTGNSLWGQIVRIYRNDGESIQELWSGFTGVDAGQAKWGDYDSDGDLDILIAGSNKSRIYRNNNGVFTDIQATLPGISSGTAMWLDYDSDSDLDVLLSGSTMTKIFTNVEGVFSEYSSSLVPLNNSSAATGDFDNDGDMDIIVSGFNPSFGAVAKFYRNDEGVYRERYSYIQGIYAGSLACADYDNDDDLDILVTGNSSSGYYTELFNNYTPQKNTEPASPENLQVAFSGNNTVFSWDRSSDAQTAQNIITYNLYVGTTTGSGDRKSPMSVIPGGSRKIVQTAVPGNSYTLKNLPAGQYYWSVQAIDNAYSGSPFATENSITVPYSTSVSPAEDQSLLINQNGTALTVNESSPASSRQWKYSEMSGGPYDRLITGATSVDLIPSFSEWGVYYIICESVIDGVVYISNEIKVDVSLFSMLNGINGVRYSSSAFGDYDNDGDQDLLLTGLAYSGQSLTSIYRNDVDHFTDINAGLEGIYSGDAEWIDIDNDNDLDIILTGGGMSLIYRNNNGIFEYINTGLPGLNYSSVSSGDFDNDGDPDILLSGSSSSGLISRIFRNDNGVFTGIDAGIAGISSGSSSWADYDNDGDEDILIVGSGYSKIYRNDNGAFTDINAGLPGVSYGTCDWGDYDSDGDYDVLITGNKGNNNYITAIFRNDNGVFPDIDAGLEGVYYGSSKWGDYDNDGDPDVLVSGFTSSGADEITRIYSNNNGVFSEINSGLLTVGNSSVIFGDVDNDSDLDVFLSGYSSQHGIISLFFRNNIIEFNNSPSAPTDISATETGRGIEFSWSRSDDTETPQAGITYNLYVGTTPGSYNRKSPVSTLADGYRKIPEKGSVHTNHYLFKGLPVGTYYWSVQAIDNSFAGSAFAPEGSFSVTFTNSIGPVTEQFLAPGQTGSPLTVTESSAPDWREWRWSYSSGGPYYSCSAYDISYSPAFADFGTYYIICISSYGGIEYMSNEIRINVPAFTQRTDITIENLAFGSNAWGDYDLDGDMDLLITGDGSALVYNNINGLFSNINAGLPSVTRSSAAWGDFDSDNDLDIVISGYDIEGGAQITRIYRNNTGVFEDINANNLAGVENGSVSWGDYDNDGDPDILVTGSGLSEVYRNESGSFNDAGISLTGVRNSSSAFSDYDNDGDLDIIVTGMASADPVSIIYRNDNGTFTDTNAGLIGVSNSSLAWGDYDQDGDPDLFITGMSSGSVPVALFYRNEQTYFQLLNVGNFSPVTSGSAQWGDYDNDGDPDLLLSGNFSGHGITRIYRQDNIWSFTDIGGSLTGVMNSSANWADYDNDGDLDFVVTGSGFDGNTSKIFRNNSNVTNVQPDAPALSQAVQSANRVTFSWDAAADTETSLNGLGYNLYIGNAPGNPNIKSPMSSVPDGYIRTVHKGLSARTWSINGLDAGTYYWSVQAVDNGYKGSVFAGEASFTVGFSNSIAPETTQNAAINENGSMLTVTESESPDSREWRYSSVSGGPYDNIFSGETGSTFIPVFSIPGTYYIVCVSAKNGVSYTSNEVRVNVITLVGNEDIILPGVRYGSVKWIDYDNDGDLDLFLAGSGSSGLITSLFRNDNGTFTDINAGLQEVYNCSAAWGDYNNDGYADLLLTGYIGSNISVSKIYSNQAGVLTETDAGLPGLSTGSGAWGDFDNDGDLDILLSGATSSSTFITRIFENTNGVFTDINAGLPGCGRGSAKWGDYDNDGDKDILLTGYDNTSYYANVFRNDNGVFTDINAGLPGVSLSAATWGDYDNDGDLDILLSGSYTTDGNAVYLTEVYRNDNGIFTDADAGLMGMNNGSASWADYDNDGDIDILVTGNSGLYSAILYRNDNGNFSDDGSGYEGINWSNSDWGDFDNDGDLDIVVCGAVSQTMFVTRVFENFITTQNTAPSAPVSLSALAESSDIVALSWDPATDTQSPQASLTYNIKVGTTPGGEETAISMASENGYRRIPAIGNVEFVTSGYNLKNLAPGIYYWSVQAIDQAFAGGEWAQESSFVLLEAPVALPATNVAMTAMTANWNPSEGAAGYRIDVSADPSFSSFVSGYENADVGNSNSVNITGLSMGTEYFYRVRAYNDLGTSILNSDVVTAVTLPDSPSGFSAISCYDIVTLSWQAFANTGNNFSHYSIYGGSESNPDVLIGSTTESDPSATSYAVSGLVRGNTYYFRIKTVLDGGIESDFTQTVPVIVRKGVVPVIRAKWDGEVLICYNIGDSISSYQWYNGINMVSNGTGQYYVTNHNPGTYTVQTTDKFGCVHTSNTINVTSAKSLVIYPNPARVTFTVRLNSGTFGKAIISIFNSSGSKVLEYQTEKTQDELLYEIGTDKLHEGVYTLQVVVNEDLSYSQVMVIK